jgi:N-acyl-D-aspartate/D-glutamate deacylase
MGEAGATDAEPDERQAAAMAALVREAVEAGAVGFTTSRTDTHLTADGFPVPGTRASERELMAIADALGELGAGVLEVIPAGAGGEAPGAYESELGLMERLSARSGRPLTFTLFQNDQAPNEWRDVLAWCDDAWLRGSAKLHPQVAGRPFGMLVGLQTTNPFRRRPSYAALADLPLPELARRLAEPGVKARILAEEPATANPRAALFPWDYEIISPLGDPPSYEFSRDDSVAAMAARAGRRPDELLYDLLLEEGGRAFLLRAMLGYSDASLEPVREMLGHPHTLLGLSDAGAHCNIMCDASMPTSMLGYWSRDRTRGPRISLERIIRMLSHEPATFYGLGDRGLIQPGYKADLNVIDYESVQLCRPELVHDLPAGGRRLIQRAVGYVATIVSGQVTFEHGLPTGVLPGRLVRRQNAIPPSDVTAAGAARGH